VLSGSIRMSGDRMRLTAELTDAHLGAALWSSRLDETCTDPFDMQYRVAEAIVRRVAPYMHAAELKRTRLKQNGLLDAYDLFLRAQETMHNSSPAVFDTAEGLFDQVLSRNPNYAAALAWRAYWHVLRVGQGWSRAPEDDARQAENFARRAIECDSTEPMAFAVHGHVASYLRKDFNSAFQCFATALELNPNAAQAWLWSAAASAWMGDGPRAVREINHAMALSPFDPLMYAYSMIAAIAHLVDGRGERAVEFARRSIRENPTYTSAHRLLVMALMMTSRRAEGREAAQELLRLEPALTVERFQQRYPGSASKHVERFCAALTEAGIPPF
jgi:adenylate cyclase